MNKFLNFLEKYFMPVAGKMAAQRHLQALRDGIILTMPLIIIGSIFLILGFIPINGYNEFMAGIFGDQWLAKLMYANDATFGMMGLLASFGIAYRLAEKYEGVDAVSAGMVSLAAFLLATPFKDGGIPTTYMGSGGLFVAIVIAMISTEIYRFIVKKNIVIKMPDSVPPAVAKSFTALIPGLIVILTIWVLRLGIEMTHFENFHEVVKILLAKPLGAIGGSLIGSIVIMGLVSLLWSAGLHGMNIVGPVMNPIWLSNTGENMAAFKAGKEIPNIFTAEFFQTFVNLGGSGGTFMLVVAMLLFAKSQQMKQLGKLSMGPGIFMINEPIVFGTPIVMNPLLIIPFFLAPIANVIINYYGMDLGLVAKPAGISVPWTTPPIIGGYLATGGHVSGAVINAITLAVDFFIYLPFFIMWDKMKKKEEDALEQVQEKVE